MAFSNISRIDAAANNAHVPAGEIEALIAAEIAAEGAMHALNHLEHHPSGVFEAAEAAWHAASDRLIAATPATPIEFLRKFEGICRENDAPSDCIIDRLLADARSLTAEARA